MMVTSLSFKLMSDDERRPEERVVGSNLPPSLLKIASPANEEKRVSPKKEPPTEWSPTRNKEENKKRDVYWVV
ncbi:unnamed protein product [Linum trigynum]|uniref:Uncharacterized protein n=1 Tax=Linum trigynum TaxID=586398 RepID=A0AAV2G634_9ROSI